MTKEEIDKWLDEEYGCSYTRLEELHDFYFEKYTDLREENKQLREEIRRTEDRLIEKDIMLEEKIEKIKKIVTDFEWRLDDVHDLIDGYYEIKDIIG